MEIAKERLRAVVPPGWDVRIGRPTGAEPPSVPTPFVHAANFPLPLRLGSFGAGALELMGPGHVFVALEEYGEDSVGTPLFAFRGLPRQLDSERFRPNAMSRVIPGLAGLQAVFTEQGRPFCLYAVIGSYANRAALVPVVNAFLAGLTVDPPGAGPPSSVPPAPTVPGSSTTSPTTTTTTSTTTTSTTTPTTTSTTAPPAVPTTARPPS